MPPRSPPRTKDAMSANEDPPNPTDNPDPNPVNETVEKILSEGKQVRARIREMVTGSVKDARVVDSTSSIFHRAALSAIRKWKYNPKIVDGKSVEQPGEQVTLDFVLEDG